MKAFTLTRMLMSLLLSLNILACTSEDEGSGLLSGPGHQFQICNKTSYSTRLLERYQEGDEDYVSLWITVGPHSCTPVSYRQTHSQYYIQSEAGRYIPGADEPAYDHSNEGIVCWDRRMLFSQKAEYNYDGHQVFLSGNCPSGMDRKPVASLKWNIEAVGDQTLIYTAMISTGKFDYNDRIDGRKFVDFSISELDRIKQEIAETEAEIERVKKGLRECSQQIGRWQKQKIFALNTDEIAQSASCGDAPQREGIKKTIDAAKEKTRQLLLAFLDSASGFFARTLARVDSVLSETFGFDEGALSSFLGVSGSAWSQQPTAAVVPALNQTLDSSYGRDHKEFLQNAHDGLLIMVEQGRRILGQLDDEEVAFAYLKQATSVREHLEGRRLENPEEVDAEGWPKDSPVPSDIRTVTIKQKIAPRDAERAARLETILKQWHNDGVPQTVINQRLAYLDALRDLGDGFVAAAADVPEVLAKMRDVLDGAITAAKDVATCLAKVGVGGDFVDWYEMTQGRDYCTGAELSFSGRVVSGAGLVFGSAKFWRVLGESSGVAVYKGKVFKGAEEAVETARRLGISNPDEIALLTKALVAPKVDPFELVPTHRLTMSRGDFKKLKESMVTEGMVRETIKFVAYDGRKYIVDGHHRARAAKELKWKEVPVEEVSLPFKGYKTIEDLFN